MKETVGYLCEDVSNGLGFVGERSREIDLELGDQLRYYIRLKKLEIAQSEELANVLITISRTRWKRREG